MDTELEHRFVATLHNDDCMVYTEKFEARLCRADESFGDSALVACYGEYGQIVCDITET